MPGIVQVIYKIQIEQFLYSSFLDDQNIALKINKYS